MLRIEDSGAPPVERADGQTRDYVNSLPSWLRDVLALRNGGRVRGIEVRVPTPMGTVEVEDVEELYCVASSPRYATTESMSLRCAAGRGRS